MPKLAGESVVAVNHLSVDNDTATNACAESNHNEILQATSHAVGHFADSGSVGIVSDGYGYAEFGAHEVGEWNWRWPGEVYTTFNAPGEVVGIRRTDTDTMDFINGIVGNDEAVDFLVEFIDVVVDVAVFCSLDRIAGNHCATSVNDTKHSVRSAHINSDNIGFAHCFCLVFYVNVSF